MTVTELNPDKYLTVTRYPRPHERFFPTDRQVRDSRVFEPIVYKCDKCDYEIQFKEADFHRHSHTTLTNLKPEDKKLIDKFLQDNSLIADNHSFLDFYCPTCKQPTTILFQDGFGGKCDYLISIKTVLVIT